MSRRTLTYDLENPDALSLTVAKTQTLSHYTGVSTGSTAAPAMASADLSPPTVPGQQVEKMAEQLRQWVEDHLHDSDESANLAVLVNGAVTLACFRDELARME